MTKKVYTKPELKSEAFVPQTHVAACGDSGTVYKFTCDAPRGTLYYFRDKPASGSQPFYPLQTMTNSLFSNI